MVTQLQHVNESLNEQSYYPRVQASKVMLLAWCPYIYIYSMCVCVCTKNVI